MPKKSEKTRVGIPARVRLGDAYGSVEVATLASTVEQPDAPVAQGRVPDDLVLPSQRHTYFQLCDLKTDAIKRLVHEEGCSTRGACSERTGWYSFKVGGAPMSSCSTFTDDTRTHTAHGFTRCSERPPTLLRSSPECASS